MRRTLVIFLGLIFFIPLIVMLANSAKPEEPTLEQCRADGKAWEGINLAIENASQEIAHATPGADLGKLDAVRNYWRQFPAAQISRRDGEMEKCFRLDRQNEKQYLFDEVYLQAEENSRYFHFLRSHKLWDEFVADDARGTR